MEHLDVQLAHRLIHGQLDAVAAVHWQGHLESCPQCRDLLAAERALLAMLELGDTAVLRLSPDVERVLDQVPAFSSHEPGQVRGQAGLAVAGLCAVVALTGLLVWQLRGANASPASPAAELGIPKAEEEQIIANLNALQALQRDPWLADEYEAVETLERQIVGREP